MAHVFGTKAFFPGHQGLIQLFPVAGTDDPCARIPKQLLDCLSQHADGGSIGLLDKQVSGVGVLKSKLYQVHCFVQVHKEPGHIRVGDGNRVACPDLVNEQRNDRTPAAHNVAVAGAADHRMALFRRHTGISSDHMFHHGLGNTHCVDWVRRLIGRKAYHPLHFGFNGRVEHIIRTFHIGLYRLHGKKLTAGYLL